MSKTAQLMVGKQQLSVSNLQKVFYPKTGFTKGEVIDYYIQIAPWLLPHLKSRPVTLKRYPDGVAGDYFYEKHCPAHKPDWIETVRVPKTSGTIDYCALNSLPSLVWAANLASLELHTFLHVAPALDRPKVVAFDLDPGKPATIIDCCVVALQLKKLFEKLSLECYPKTSGSKGLQVYLPLNSSTRYEKTKEFARHVAEAMEQLLPKLVVARMAVDLRAGKVFIDWSQNDAHKTTVSVYSLRGKEFPSVSTPVTWREVHAAVKSRKAARLQFTPDAVIKRVRRYGDLFLPVLKLKQRLPPKLLSK